ncbi:MAG: diphthine--ammonia ligase [Desulfurococcales archaeon]|nr:diphthine--ammonia ligase [Desulfurococcales archaeon]
MKKFCSLLSGGKDSNYALYRALKNGWEPACILSIRPRQDYSWMFHTPLVDYTTLQAEAIGLRDRLVVAEVSGVKEKEVEELLHILKQLKKEYDYDTIVVGALASRYQYERIRRISEETGTEVYAPAWQMDPVEYMKLLINERFIFIITRISTYGLKPEILGRPISLNLLEEILEASKKYGFHPAFEGGEAETLVIDAPHYRKKLCLKGSRERKGPYNYDLQVEKVWLADKDTANCIIIE